MTMFIYAAIAIAFLILVLVLLHKPPALDPDEAFTDKGYTRNIGNGRWLDLSERIFDPSDARWLADELAFPKLAKALTLGRQRLAIFWLEALQSSFDELVRTPEATPNEAPEATSGNNWKILWLTIRFKLLVSYALIVVKVFGPYHRLVPSFSWIPLSPASERSFRRAALADSRGSH
jgi:hypothetical protein